ncbi:hypothetical protein J2P12_07315, partial [Candidatus Bathyarchaeota archaeon]|nr:hypothetical protein [Candidatus Bathyarchaeota archaeon]
VMIHVLHLMRDWVQAIHEAGRVTRKIIVSEAGDFEGFSPRQQYLDLRKEMGYPLSRLNGGEFELREFVHPKLVVSAGDYWTEFDAHEEISEFEERKSSVMWDVPGDVHRKIMERLYQENRGRLRRHDMPEVVGWDPKDLRAYRK